MGLHSLRGCVLSGLAPVPCDRRAVQGVLYGGKADACGAPLPCLGAQGGGATNAGPYPLTGLRVTAGHAVKEGVRVVDGRAFVVRQDANVSGAVTTGADVQLRGYPLRGCQTFSCLDFFECGYEEVGDFTVFGLWLLNGLPTGAVVPGASCR